MKYSDLVRKTKESAQFISTRFKGNSTTKYGRPRKPINIFRDSHWANDEIRYNQKRIMKEQKFRRRYK